MKIYIMTDMEGVAGVLDAENWCQPPERGGTGRYYELGREFLTREVNACIDGLCRAGADDILVSDGHGAGGIQPALLDRRAKLLRGWPNGWPFELDESFDAVVFIGQHAKAGSIRAHLAHTQSFRYLDHSINGLSIGEFGQFVLCAGELGVPCIFGSGDEAFCQEAMALVPDIVTVSVKQGLRQDSGAELTTAEYARHNLGAIHLHPDIARAAICERARAALARFREAGPGYGLVKLEPPYERVTILRPEEKGQPKRIDRASHPSSVIALLNLPYHYEPLEE
ncbi:MAG: M55 family metallopeptidase [Chloroflexi bacterium]|nr:M55 family metallopeptidase [Chloroflexota bacterium]